MGGRGGNAYSYSQWRELQELIHPSYRVLKEKEHDLPYNITRSSELYAGTDHAFFSDTEKAFSIVTYDATDSIESLGLESRDTYGEEPVIRWISDGQVNDVYLQNMNLEEFYEETGFDISMPKGGYVASKRMSRVLRDYRVQMFLPDNSLKIQYLERDKTRDAIWDGAGLINRKVLQKMQLGPLEEAIEALEFEAENGRMIDNQSKASLNILREIAGEPLLELDETRTEAEIKLEKLRARHKKLSRELQTCNRIEYTVMTEKGQDKGHAIVCDNLMGDDGKTEVDFILLDSDTKPETKLMGREWVGINFVHGHDHMKLDSQSLIHMQEFFDPEFLQTCVEQEGELFLKAFEDGSAGTAMARVNKNKTLEEIKGWPLEEYLVRGGDLRWSPHLSKTFANQHLKRIANRATPNKVNIPVPGGRYYVIPDKVGERGGATREVPRGEIRIDPEYGTAWVNHEDWQQLEDSPSGKGLASIWGGADNDDALWIFPFTDYDNEKKVLAWRSPNLLGEYAILKPSEGTPELKFEQANGNAISYPKADSRKLPPRIDTLDPIQSTIDPDSALNVGAGAKYSVEAMAPAVERAKENAGAVGLFCNALMVEAGLHNGRPEDLPAALDHVIDAAVKTGVNLALVKEWCMDHTKAILRQGVPIPKLLKRRLAHDRDRDPDELVPPVIETPKDSQHFLDIIDRHLTEHVEYIKERREAQTKTYAPPVRLVEHVFIEDSREYGPDILKAGAEFNQQYSYLREKILKRKRWGNEDDQRLRQQIHEEIHEMDEETKRRQLRQYVYEDTFTGRARAKRRAHPYVPGQRNDPALLTEEDHEAIVAETDRRLEHLFQTNQAERKLQEKTFKKQERGAKKKKEEWTDTDHDELRRGMIWETRKYDPETRKAVVRAAIVSAHLNDEAKSDAAVWTPGFDGPFGRIQGVSDITMSALSEIGLLQEIYETEDGVMVYPEPIEQSTYSSVGIKYAGFNWYKSYAEQNGRPIPAGHSKKELAEAGTSHKEIRELWNEAAFDYRGQSIEIKARADADTEEQKLIAYTPDGIELGEVSDPTKVAQGLEIKIEFAFARSGNLQIAFDRDATKDIIF